MGDLGVGLVDVSKRFMFKGPERSRDKRKDVCTFLETQPSRQNIPTIKDGNEIM